MKRYLLILLIIFIINNAYCDEISYVVTQDSILERNSVRTSVSEGDIVFFQGRTTGDRTRGYRILVKTDQGREGWIDVNNILLKDTQPLHDSITAKYWIFSYYQDILIENNKEALFKHEPFWRDDYEDHAKRADGPHQRLWWRMFKPTYFALKNNLTTIATILYSDYLFFVHTEQRQEGNNVILDVICIDKNNRHPQYYLNKLFNVGEEYRLILKIDGDYMDVYIDGEPNKIFSLISVDDYFLQAINSIVQKDSTDVGLPQLEAVDFSKITWPRRADGTMDYPPPSITTSNDQGSSQEIEQTLDSEITLENESPQTTESDQFPLWLFIGGGLVLLAVGVGVVVVVKRKKG